MTQDTIHWIKAINPNDGREFDIAVTRIISYDGQPVDFKPPETQPTGELLKKLETRQDLHEAFMMSFYSEWRQFFDSLEKIEPETPTTSTPETNQETKL